MKAIGQFIIIKQDPEEIKKTSGGLELNEKTREDIRYRTGSIISAGSDAQTYVAKGEKIMFDRAAGHTTDITGEEYKVITLRDVVAII